MRQVNYKVKVKVTPMSNAFASLNLFDPDAVIELVQFNDKLEIYEIETEFDIDILLDASKGVIEYTSD